MYIYLEDYQTWLRPGKEESEKAKNQLETDLNLLIIHNLHNLQTISIQEIINRYKKNFEHLLSVQKNLSITKIIVFYRRK